MNAHLFARCIRGIEWVAAAEIEAFAEVTGLGHREVHFQGSAERALSLGTVDDVFRLCARAEGIGRERASLAKLAEAASAIDMDDRAGSLEVVASFLGRRNYNRYDIEDTVGEELARRGNFQYNSRREGATVAGDTVIRVHIRNEEAAMGVRLSAVPLHRRAYKTEAPPGSLHPPPARALVMISDPTTDSIVLDPFCGAGTIPIEAAIAGFRASGSDADEEAVGMAKRNAARAGVAAALCVADAGRMPWRRADRIVTNTPWGRETEIRGAASRWFQEAGRVLGNGGSAVVLIEDPKHVSRLEPKVTLQQRISLFGSHPVIVLAGADLPEPLARWRAHALDNGLL